jgi:ribonuclease P protein component
MDVFFTRSPASRSRLGVIVAKHGHEIVERNRLKRRLRELGRRRLLPALERAGVGRDVLIRARRSAYDIAFEGLALEMAEVTEALCSDES